MGFAGLLRPCEPGVAQQKDLCCMQVFLEGVKAALTADAKFQGGWYSPENPPVTGLRAAARVYAGWGFSQPFYWHEVFS